MGAQLHTLTSGIGAQLHTPTAGMGGTVPPTPTAGRALFRNNHPGITSKVTFIKYRKKGRDRERKGRRKRDSTDNRIRVQFSMGSLLGFFPMGMDESMVALKL